MSSETPSEERIAFKAKRKQEADARSWRHNEQYENDLKALEADPQAANKLSADHRSILWYYRSARDAAEAEGLDITGGNQR